MLKNGNTTINLSIYFIHTFPVDGPKYPAAHLRIHPDKIISDLLYGCAYSLVNSGSEQASLAAMPRPSAQAPLLGLPM
jgi:hypothetical protein